MSNTLGCELYQGCAINISMRLLHTIVTTQTRYACAEGENL